MKRATIVSGITATGKLTLGNYLGAIKNIVACQNDHDNFVFVADLHALTTYIQPAELAVNRRQILALYLACGVDPEKTALFFQSEVAAHSQLHWILMCQSTMGELTRMIQFKDKSQKAIKQANGTEMVPTGLFTYPTLMAADILLYNGQLVPVGADQKQHLELAQTLIRRLNKKYKLTFNVPKPLIAKIGYKVAALTDPEQKMSKSDTNPNASIYLLDDPDLAYKKIQRAITDSENKIYLADHKPGIKNLLTIYAGLEAIELSEAEAYFTNKNYQELKHEVGQSVKEFLIKIQIRYKEYLEQVDLIASAGAQRAATVAAGVLSKIYKALGLQG